MSQLQPAQVRTLRDGFQLMDRDSDGVVNREDVADMLTQLGTLLLLFSIYRKEKISYVFIPVHSTFPFPDFTAQVMIREYVYILTNLVFQQASRQKHPTYLNSSHREPHKP